MNTRNLLSLMTFGGLVALVACSSSTTDAGPFASSDSFCASKSEAECNNLAKKCGSSVDACKSKRLDTCNKDAAAAKNVGRAYRSGAAQACIDKINDVYKDQAANITPTTEADAKKICDRVFGGAKQEREPCANTFECDGALVCDGVCAKEEIVAINGGCGNAGQKCDNDTYCQPTGNKLFCVAKNKLGDNCDAVKNPCIESLRCVNQCTAKETVGQPCSNDGDCAIEAPFCDLTTSPKKCRPKYESSTPACHEFGSTL